MRSSNWLSTWTTTKSTILCQELALNHARCGGSQGAAIIHLIKINDLKALCSFSLDYDVGSSFELYHCRQALAMFQKSKFISIPDTDPLQASIDTWLKSEARCLETNELFRELEEGRLSIDPRVSAIFHSASRKISRVLGSVPTFQDLAYRFGPGATTLTKKRMASVSAKLSDGISCSEELFPYASRILEEMPYLAELHSTSSVRTVDDECETTVHNVNLFVTNDVIHFVPKTAKTHRAIAVGGSLNIMVQLALGDYMSERLAAVGVDLRDQSYNQRLAKEGSITGKLATIDLSSASDTISYKLVSHLLPLDWLIALEACRSQKCVLQGSIFTQEKFSSQGNGYTFPLESLIFWAIASSCSESGFASVYGDDIIVLSEDYELVVKALDVAGFIVNKEKSFSTGPFRESCGADYHKGTNIRPYYQKDNFCGPELFKLHNYYVRSGQLDFAEVVFSYINPDVVIFGPDGFGDGHLIGDWEPLPSTWKCRKKGFGGYFFSTYKLSSRKSIEHRKSKHVLPLYQVYRRSSEDPFSSLQPQSKRSLTSFLLIAKFKRKRFALAPLELSEKKEGSDSFKLLPLPGSSGYEKIKVYTFDSP